MLVALAAAAVWFGLWEPFPRVSVIGVVGLAIGGWPIFKEAFENVLQRRMTMELSMSIAIVAAAAIGEFFTALVITLFVLVAEVLEGMTVGRGRKAIRDLLEFLPREVSVRRTGAVKTISANELSVGDAILIAPGGRIPVDGIVLSGHSFVDESRIPLLTINLLQALPKTPLWDRLHKADRLADDPSLESNVRFLRPYDEVVATWRRCIAYANDPERLFSRFHHQVDATYVNRMIPPAMSERLAAPYAGWVQRQVVPGVDHDEIVLDAVKALREP